ncbi:hypothetical protein GUITHDRAFT_144426 [Guillardia theta CCMP2712]|uniref:Uncharacterized protein n=1 Tax=Guillardia theta (strain CCMP2712) TaxID=905079 RepID=L1IPT6_GUITC|nr:hypothetical protein GUITHDRAFT_144426 [Guillardia theta CCMP2712]EKX38112.1 hypothetical protein GUITHDRAFT_144426 [Guillardia theta CCMP2712]|eukprot:XP_005825092.1 hypothetical protein GUITHDRAFT_144426 [Guillardia theta CCMP2712]
MQTHSSHAFQQVGSRSAAHVAAFSCLSMIIVAMLVLHDHGSENLQVELQSSSVGSDSSMQDMQKEAERQLVDAAKRKMHALSHKVNAVKLSSSAREDQTKAELLKKKAILGRRQEDLDKADKAVQDAQKELKHIKEEEKTSSSTSDNDSAKADKAKEDIMNLESEAGTFNEKAQEEEQKIVLVKAAAAKEAAKIPELFKSARNAEDEADKLKLVARNKMQDSKRKSEEAFRLDKVAEEKEREAHMIRKKLISILEEKTKMLYTKEQDASRQKLFLKVYAKKAAKEAAKEAQKLAALAAAKARLAKKAEDQLNRDIGEEREAEATVNDGINNVKMKENAVRDAKRAFEDLKRKAGGGREEEENDEAPEVDEKVVEETGGKGND